MYNKRKYLKDLVKNGHLLVALLLTSFAMTFIIANYEFGILSVVRQYIHLINFLLVAFVIFAVLVLIYAVKGLFSKKTTVADSIYLAVLLSGIGFMIYSVVVLDSLSARRLMVILFAIFAGFIPSVIRLFTYSNDHDSVSHKISLSIIRYVKETIKSCSIIPLIITSAVCVCLTYFFSDIIVIRLFNDNTLFIVSLVCLLPTLLYGISSLRSRKLTALDSFGVAYLVALPMMVMTIFTFALSKLKLLVLVISLLVYVIFVVFRIANYNPLKAKEVESPNGYVKCVLAKYNVLLIASIGGLIALIAMLVLKCDILLPLYLKKTLTVFTFAMAPTFIITILALIALAILAMMTLFGCAKKGVNVADFALAVNLSFIFFGFVTLIAHPSNIMFWGLTAFLVFSVIILLIRLKNYNKQ